MIHLLGAAAPPLLENLAILVVAGALIAFVSHRVGVVPIVGFLVAGAVVGPNGLALVGDTDLVNQAAEVGVVLLLFTIGIEFSLGRLRQMASLILVGGAIQVGLTIAAVTGILAIGGVQWRTGVYTGMLVALSSTAIVLKILADRGSTTSGLGRVSIALLIFQDLAIVAMVLLVPMLGSGTGGGPGDALVALAKATGVIVLVLVAARTAMPRVLDAVARTCSAEVFLLTIAGICFGTAYLTSLADVSVSLGAFMAGLVVSESRLSGQALSDILPLQILFSATFFVSVGMLVEIDYLIGNIHVVLAIAGSVVALKALTVAAAAAALRQGAAAVLGASLTLAQIGEFSFVLERVGVDAGLEPFGIDAGSDAFIAVTVLLMVLSPFGAQLGDRLSESRTRPLPAASRRSEPAPVPVHGHSGLVDHVVVAGFGPHGRTIARALDLADVPYVVTTLDPDAARVAEDEGRRVVRGDITRRFVAEQAGVARARLVTVVDDDPDRVYHVASVVRAGVDVPILARVRTNDESAELLASGLVSHCVADASATDDALVSHVLGNLAFPESFVDVVVEDAVGTMPQSGEPLSKVEMGTVVSTDLGGVDCGHFEAARAVTPSSGGCAECLASGDRWVHLRMCLSCGHVGCCDSSPHRHARSHAASAGHPLARSIEPGEMWAWCYVDRVTLPVLDSPDPAATPSASGP